MLIANTSEKHLHKEQFMNAVSDIQIPLDHMIKGSSGKIARLTGENDDSETQDRINRLREIGFAEGLTIELLHQSPFGKDPIAVRVGAMTIALRRSEANLVKVQIL